MGRACEDGAGDPAGSLFCAKSEREACPASRHAAGGSLRPCTPPTPATHPGRVWGPELPHYGQCGLEAPIPGPHPVTLESRHRTQIAPRLEWWRRPPKSEDSTPPFPPELSGSGSSRAGAGGGRGHHRLCDALAVVAWSTNDRSPPGGLCPCLCLVRIRACRCLGACPGRADVHLDSSQGSTTGRSLESRSWWRVLGGPS